MKVLIGYDGSTTASAAIAELKSAGLPAEAEAIVLSVAEIWLPPENVSRNREKTDCKEIDEAGGNKPLQRNQKVVSEAESFAHYAQQQLRKCFPEWKIEAAAAFGSPAWEIITKAREINADLIVVAAHGRSEFDNYSIGSISQKVLTEAHCSVRITRSKISGNFAPPRVIIGYDGSPGADAAVETVAARIWNPQTEFCLAAITDPIMPSAIGRFVSPVTTWVAEAKQNEHQWIEKIAANALHKLRSANLSVSLDIQTGNPKMALIEKAARWHADTIFLGANRFGIRVEPFLLGSVAAAVAARARCSVEIVRA